MQLRYLIPAALAYVSIAFIPTDAGASTLPVAPPLPPGKIEMVTAPCPGAPKAAGCVLSGVVYTDGVLSTDEHELGHLYDERVLDDGARRKLTRVVGFPAGTPWRSATMFARSPSEVTADAYMTCRLRMLPDGSGALLTDAGVALTASVGTSWVSAYKYRPSNAVHRQVCGILDRAGQRRGI